MSIRYPVTIEELTRCQGVGEGKARKFGEEYLKVIARYIEENDIVRPDDMVVKSAPNKSEKRIFIITSIDRRIPFEDIADARDMEMDELLDNIESIISSGTRLNINYYIHQTIDDYKVDDIYSYFKEEADSDSVTDALKALGPDYTEEEVRLVRIKFLSEMGN